MYRRENSVGERISKQASAYIFRFTFTGTIVAVVREFFAVCTSLQQDEREKGHWTNVMRKSFGAEFKLIRMIKRNATKLCTGSIEFLRKSVADVNSNRPVFIQLGNFFLHFTAYEFLFYFLFTSFLLKMMLKLYLLLAIFSERKSIRSFSSLLLPFAQSRESKKDSTSKQ